ncbi:MAG: hypothetical protein IPK53_07330 [bacterium]|nr:hypothetical protein [bacterium]
MGDGGGQPPDSRQFFGADDLRLLFFQPARSLGYALFQLGRQPRNSPTRRAFSRKTAAWSANTPRQPAKEVHQGMGLTLAKKIQYPDELVRQISGTANTDRRRQQRPVGCTRLSRRASSTIKG